MAHDDDSSEEIADKTSVIQSDTFKLRIQEAVQSPPSLVLLVGPSASVGRQWPIEDTDLIIGRTPNASIFVDDRSLSKSHVKLVLISGEVSIIDLESTNRTHINGKAIQPLTQIRLKNNDQLKMGNIIFKFLEQGNIEAVASAQTFDRSQTDALTGLANRGALEAQSPELYKRSELLGIPLSLVVFDIDKFKRVNDTWGHPAGDYILREISAVVKSKLIRETDFFARAGGEEFCLVLLGSPIKQAEEVAERIRVTIEEHHFQFEDQVIPITTSAGVATKSVGDQDWGAVYERADKALYVSKNSGRNRVTLG